jgi:phosphoglycolate phosphatase
MLDELSDRDCKLAVLSNKPHEFAVKCVAHYFGAWNFSPVFGQRDSIPTKPDPVAVHEIMELLGTTPEKTMYVGDSDVDMETAHRAGVTSAGACWGFRTMDELHAAGADYLLEHPSDLLKIL